LVVPHHPYCRCGEGLLTYAAQVAHSRPCLLTYVKARRQSSVVLNYR
jgi:hypothetical protein